MRVDRLTCQCAASFDFFETIGTTTRYVEYCPACGGGPAKFEIETVEVET